jgi:hypothetical protein
MRRVLARRHWLLAATVATSLLTLGSWSGAAVAAAPGNGSLQPAPTATLARPSSRPAPPSVGPSTTQPGTGSPSTTTPPSGPGLRQPAPSGGPGLFDFAGRIRQAVNDWFRDLVVSAAGPGLDLLSTSVLATPNVAAPGSRAAELWWVSAGLANTAYVLLVVIGGALLVGHETVQTRYSVKEIAPRLVLGFVAANTSLLLAGRGIELANALSRALLGQGVDPAHVTDQIRQLALAPLDQNGIFGILAVGVVAILALVVVATYVIRVAMVVVLVAGAPLLLSCHALPQTEGLARGWWRGMAACLGVQVGQSLLLISAVRVFFAADRPSVFGLSQHAQIVDLIVVACLLWLLVRLPVWAGRAALDGGRRSRVVGLVKSLVLYRMVRGVLR